MERAQAEARMEEILGWLNAMRQGWVQHDSKQAAALQKEHAQLHEWLQAQDN
ncbi:hypothetical protein [Aeromonas caviae]|jgi:hypothetical protein|uniref:hypothetical protein n=1 Tax=Aeromonas caviae TaxID=648 RepID=UPI0013A5A247|nr:hypothetical protein [Aeromonas caviae]